jgi:transketolase
MRRNSKDRFDMKAQLLAEKAAHLRRIILESVVASGKGHIGGALSCIDILVALYHGGILKVDSKRPNWPDRDRFRHRVVCDPG